jgi:hypothetical protein
MVGRHGWSNVRTVRGWATPFGCDARFVIPATLQAST